MNIDFKYLFHQYQVLYIYGKTYTGKSTSILNYIKENNKDHYYYSIQDLKNEKDFMSLLQTQNVMSMFQQKKNEKYIIIDNIDVLQNNDKKMINFFIKFFKTKKHQNYKNTYFIFIGSNEEDKKVQELWNHMDHKIETISKNKLNYKDDTIKEMVIKFLQTKSEYLSELRDKNIISLCFHENMIYYLNKDPILYEKCLYYFCKGDYYDRMSFKKQLWLFNEMTFYLKVVLNSHLLKKQNIIPGFVFTKILTKFSNQYSNMVFLNQMCLRVSKQKEELYLIFQQENHPCLNQFTISEKKRLSKLLF